MIYMRRSHRRTSLQVSKRPELRENYMEKNRLEAFSDGVLAIIITIMVLELKQPAGDSLSDFFDLASTLLAYLLSFMFVAIYRVNHHIIFHDVKTVNYPILWRRVPAVSAR